MAFNRVVNGNITDDDDLNQIIRAWEGDADGGSHPLLLTEVDDAVNYATDVRQKDASVGLLARWRNYNDENVMRLTKDAVLLDKDVTLAAGKYIDSLRPLTHNHTGEVGMGPVLTHASLENRMRLLWIPVESAYNNDAGTAILRTTSQGHPLPDSVTSYAFGSFVAPTGFVSLNFLNAWYTAASSVGNVCVSLQADYGGATAGDSYREHSTIKSETLAVGGNTPLSTGNLPLAELAAGDRVQLVFQRTGGDAADTHAGDLFLLGFQVYITVDM
jgi:hypothetical protein